MGRAIREAIGRYSSVATQRICIVERKRCVVADAGGFRGVAETLPKKSSDQSEAESPARQPWEEFQNRRHD